MRPLALLVLTGAAGAAAFAPLRHSPLRPTATVLAKVCNYRCPLPRNPSPDPASIPPCRSALALVVVEEEQREHQQERS